MKRLAIFASGSGSNAQRIHEYFHGKDTAIVSLIITNNKNAFVIERAKNLGIECILLTKEDFRNEEKILPILQSYKIDYIVLAGFLLLIPHFLVIKFPNRIINIHPALLPAYGGKGMYGMNVHRAIIENHEKESGISIHFVNEHYDEGKIIFQAKCNIAENDTPELLAEKIHELEYKHFPAVIESVVSSN